MIKVMLKNFFIESRRMTAFQLFPVRGHILRILAYIYGLVTSQIEIKPRDEPLMATLADKSDLMQAAHSEETGQKELQNIHLNLAHQYLQSETTKSIYGEKESEGLMIYVPIQQKGLVLDNTKKARFLLNGKHKNLFTIIAESKHEPQNRFLCFCQDMSFSSKIPSCFLSNLFNNSAKYSFGLFPF